MFPSGLSMLWESTDPDSALQTRFGLDGLDDAVSWLTAALARAWDIEVEAVERILISDANAIAWVHTGQGTLVAKWTRAQEQFARLSAIADLLRSLHRRGSPVAPPLATVDGAHRVVIGSGALPLSMMVQPHVDGDLLDTTDVTAVRRAGACLAALHAALAGHRDPRLVEHGRPMDLRPRIETWLEHDDAGRAPDASARLRDTIASLPPIDTEPQLIHGDYRASNILTAGSQVRAVIDFDRVAWRYCVHDLANAFVRIGTYFTNWKPTPVQVRDALAEGYQSVRPLTGPEHRWLDALALWYGIQAIPAGADQTGWADAV